MNEILNFLKFSPLFSGGTGPRNQPKSPLTFGALVTMADQPHGTSSSPIETAILKLTTLQVSLGETVQSMAQKFDELLLRLPSTSPSPSSQPIPSISPVPSHQHRMKLDIPRFDGTDPFGWVFKINQYFQYHATPEHDRLTIVSFYMDGRALAWFQWMATNGQLTSWPTFI